MKLNQSSMQKSIADEPTSSYSFKKPWRKIERSEEAAKIFADIIEHRAAMKAAKVLKLGNVDALRDQID